MNDTKYDKRLLIIGASILQLPAISLAKELGYYVGVIDYNPSAIGVPYADEFFCVSTIDIDGVVKTAEEFKPDGIMTLATDMPMRSIAAACEKLGLCGISFDTAIKSTDKGEMIRTFEVNGVEHPWYYILSNPNEFEDVIANITFPCISKPTDNSGSRGVILIHNDDELRDAVSYSSSNGRCGGVIVEEYMVGPEVSVEIISVDGQPHVLQVTDKLTTGAPHFVEMGHSQPSRLPESDVIKIKDLACRAVKAVGIENGPAHVEIILTDNGPKMVELGARMGGDCITTHLVPLSTGVNMIESTIRIACGEIPDIKTKTNKGSAIRYFNPRPGEIKEIRGVEAASEIKGVCEISFVKNVGDNVGSIGSSTDRAGFVIAQANTAEEAVRICEQACKMIEIVTV
ncbi:MAG: ATP-grasp domain-containing protein [Clostridia bacterium]|nr:ATP-grasp domain-containing protein [Clostridia bacterium]